MNFKFTYIQRIKLGMMLLGAGAAFLSSCKKESVPPSLQVITQNDTTSKDTLSQVTINLSGVRNTNGNIQIALYNSEAGFNDPNQALRKILVAATGANMSVKLDSLRAGTYAFALFHDENNNTTLDVNWLKIPTEGFAFSNNAMGSFGPPSYSQCQFNVPAKSLVIQGVSLQYF